MFSTQWTQTQAGGWQGDGKKQSGQAEKSEAPTIIARNITKPSDVKLQ
jgi:hypothetical protein